MKKKMEAIKKEGKKDETIKKRRNEKKSERTK